MTIPQLDFSLLQQGEAGYKELAQDFYDAYSTLGFATIVNHSIASNLIENLFEQMQAFHALPAATKMKYKYGKYLRGFLPMNISTLKSSTLADVKKPNQSESFMILSEPYPEEGDILDDTPFGGAQVWPDELPHFKKIALDYYDRLCQLGDQLVTILELALDLPKDTLKPHFTHPNIFFRMLFYPPTPLDSAKDLFGSAPHTDYGCFTFLLQDATGGLQVKSPDDEWLDVPYQKDTFILNTGDMIEHWSNGILKSTPHRVINKSHNQPRYSVPFFYNCNFLTKVKPLPTCISQNNPAQFEEVVYGDTLTHKMRTNYRFDD